MPRPPVDPPRDPMVEGLDWYREGIAVVFTSEYHLRRGWCCENRCRHCPYGFGPGLPDPVSIAPPAAPEAPA
ncbi:MAG: DUF5522 domain-containing protein [Lacipirellulaceae bacterium]